VTGVSTGGGAVATVGEIAGGIVCCRFGFFFGFTSAASTGFASVRFGGVSPDSIGGSFASVVGGGT
jgi:hypothetical protein